MRRLMVSEIFLMCICVTFMLFTACATPDEHESDIVVSPKNDGLNTVSVESVLSNSESQTIPSEKAVSSELEKSSKNLISENSQVTINDEDNSSMHNSDNLINDNTNQGTIYLPKVP